MNEPNITIEEVNWRIIYIRFRGSYVEFRKNSQQLFNELFAFAQENKLVDSKITKVITIYDDNPFITNQKQLRTSVAMIIPEGIEIQENGRICKRRITGKFGVGHFTLTRNEYGTAWEYMYQKWLFSGIQKPRDAVPFELYVTEPPKSARGISETAIYIPIE